MRLLFRTSGLVVFIFIFCFTISNSQSLTKIGQAEVGMQPTSIHWDSVRNQYIVFCQGLDTDFDGVCDTNKGDVPASWWVLKNVNQTLVATKIKDFSFAYPILPPTKPLLVFDNDKTKDRVYINFEYPLAKVISFDLNTGEIVDSSFINKRVDNIQLINSNFVYISNPKPGADGIISIYDSNTKKDIKTIPTYGQNTLNFFIKSKGNETDYYVLNIGKYGDTSNLAVVGDFQNGFETLANLKVGITGNTLIERNNTLCTVSNTSHEIFFINTDSYTIISNIKTPTSGNNGPYDAVYLTNDIVAVTTLNKEVLLIDKNLGILQSIPTVASTTGIDYSNGIVSVCNSFNADYSPNKTIEFFKFNIVKSVEENNELSKISLFPNPSTNTIKINSNYNINSVELIDLFGDILLNKNNCNSNDLTIDLRNLNLSTGQYFVRIETDNGIENKVISYIK